MTPKDLSSATVVARLQVLDELLEDLASLGAPTGDQLRARRIERRALERIVSQLVEVASDINQHAASTVGGAVASDYRGSFDLAVRIGMIPEHLAEQLKPSVGLRNVLTHQYVNVDLDILASVVPEAVTGYRGYRRAVAAWLANRPEA